MSPSDVFEPRVEPQVESDAALDAVHTEDVEYLGQLGYRQELKRALGFFSSFGVQFTGIAIAGGLSLTFGYGLATVGPAMILAWVVAGALQMVVGLSVAEGVSAYPLAGGAYQIINRLADVRLGWQVGWWLILAHIAAVAAEATGLSVIIASWFGVELTTHGEILRWAIPLIVICALVNLLAVKIAAAVNNLFGVAFEFIAIAILVVGLVIALVIGDHDFQSVSFLGSDAGILGAGDSALLPFLYAMLVPAFVISGFDVNGTAGEETEGASRTVPRALLTASFVAYGFGTVMLLLSILAISNFEAVAGAPAPLTFLLQDVLGKVPGKTFEVCAVLSLVVNMMILQLTAARVIWSQARDGQMPFPRLMTKLTADQVPLTAVIVASLIAIGFCLWTGLLTVLISMTAILWAAGYAVLVGVLMWGKSRNALPHARPFTNGRWSPLVDSVALIWSVGLCVILIKQNPSDVGWGFLVTIVVGLLLYFVLIPPGRRGVIKDVRDEPDAALVAETS